MKKPAFPWIELAYGFSVYLFIGWIVGYAPFMARALVWVLAATLALFWTVSLEGLLTAMLAVILMLVFTGFIVLAFRANFSLDSLLFSISMIFKFLIFVTGKIILPVVIFVWFAARPWSRVKSKLLKRNKPIKTYTILATISLSGLYFGWLLNQNILPLERILLTK